MSTSGPENRLIGIEAGAEGAQTPSTPYPAAAGTATGVLTSNGTTLMIDSILIGLIGGSLAGISLLAAADDSTAAIWGQYGLAGVLVLAVLWFIRHLVTTTFPQMLATFTAELTQERAARATQHKDNREDHKHQIEMLGRLEDDLRGEIQQTRHAIKGISTSLSILVGLLRRDGLPPPDDPGIK